MPIRPMRFSLWYFLALFLILLAVQTLFSLPRHHPVSYRDFRRLVEIKGVEDLEISGDRITGVLLPNGVEYLAGRPGIRSSPSAWPNSSPNRCSSPP